MKTCAPGLMIFLLFIMVNMSVPGSAYGRISLKERDALEALYNKTNGRNWRNQENWKKAPGTEASWHGIICDTGNTTVLKIELKGNNLQGVLPADMEAFSNLTILDLSDNQLTGEIPHWIEKLKNLKTLDLGNNNFKGPIPAWLGNLKNLEELILDNNRLEGPILGELGNLANLKFIRIAGNRLTGEIPIGLSNLVNLKDNQSNFKWNGLYTQDSELKNFLGRKQIDKDWESTQTVPPAEIKVMGFTENSLTIDWQPIPYTADKGGYRIFYREASRQDYDDKSIIEKKGKSIHNANLKDLKKGVKYVFKILTWTESHSKNKNEIESVFSNEFPAATGGIIISGTITDKRNGEGFAGVQLTASNGGGTAETDKDGIYKLNIMPGWTGTLTPSRKGFKFSPPSMNYESEVASDSNANDYIAESDTVISGTVTFKGKAVDNVTIKFEGANGDDYSALTDTNGNYQQEVAYGWSGMVTPMKDGHGFDPEENEYKNITSSVAGQNYEVQLPKIFGRVKIYGGKGVSGFKLEFSDMKTSTFNYLEETAETDKDGKYDNFVLKSWQGRVTPHSSQNKNFQITPPYRLMLTPEAAKKEQNFSVCRNYKFFVSISQSYMNSGEYYYAENINTATKLGYKLSRFFYLWCRYYLIVKTYNPDDVNDYSWILDRFSTGVGFSTFEFTKNEYLSSDLIFNLGIVRLTSKYSNENSVSDKIWGFSLGEDIIFNINHHLFTVFSFTGIFSKMKPIYNAELGLGCRF